MIFPAVAARGRPGLLAEAQLSQALVRAAAHKSRPTRKPVEPLVAVDGGLTLGRAGAHTFDIRV